MPKLLTADDIRGLRYAAPDHHATQLLKAECARLRRARGDSFHLTFDELDRIVRWKLGSQYGRVKRHWLANRDHSATVEQVTAVVFSLGDAEVDYGLRVRMALLCSLPGIDIRVASAVLALTEPERYCVMDVRGWRQLFGEEKSWYGLNDYVKYLVQVRALATDLGWTPQETDLAIWARDLKMNS